MKLRNGWHVPQGAHPFHPSAEKLHELRTGCLKLFPAQDEIPASLHKQAILNLLGNAIKFTRHTTDARIRIDSHHDPASGETVYRAQDNGSGFDMTYANKLFGVLQRLHGADVFEGTGVGLSIVQKVIKRHDGRVWDEAKPGAGATFFFTLPGVAAMP